MAEILTGERVKEMLPPRFSDSNKGDYGKTAILAGSARYSGAAVLALSGALRGGAGYVAAGVPEKLIFRGFLKIFRRIFRKFGIKSSFN